MPGFLIPLLIAGGAKLIDAFQQRSAAGKASEQQQQAAERAKLDLRGAYGQGRADLDPYAQAGQQSLTSLTSLLGLPGLPATAAPTAPGTGGPFQGRGPAPMTDGSVTGYAIDRGTPPGAPQTTMVVMRAPTGETRPVPANQVQYYLARGATIVPVDRGGGGSVYSAPGAPRG